MMADDYSDFMKDVESPSFKALKSDATRGHYSTERKRYSGLMPMASGATSLGAGQAAMICIFGSETAAPFTFNDWRIVAVPSQQAR